MGLILFAVFLGAAAPAAAQLEENLASYRDETAEGYLRPLAEAFGQTLNSGFFTTAAVPRAGFRARLEVHASSVFFGDSDRTFLATTGGNFIPEQSVEAPTVVGSEKSRTVTGDGGTEYIFPGGFDLGSFTLAVPQLTVGAVAGTEATVRWIAVDTGDADIGNISLLGFGVRHSISQYLQVAPFSLTASVFYQEFTVGDDDLLDAKGVSLGVQGSRSFGAIEAFASLALDSFDLTAEYTVNEGEEDEERLSVDVDAGWTPHAAVGVGVGFGVVHLHLAGSLSDRVGISGGIGLGL